MGSQWARSYNTHELFNQDRLHLIFFLLYFSICIYFSLSLVNRPSIFLLLTQKTKFQIKIVVSCFLGKFKENSNKNRRSLQWRLELNEGLRRRMNSCKVVFISALKSYFFFSIKVSKNHPLLNSTYLLKI